MRPDGGRIRLDAHDREGVQAEGAASESAAARAAFGRSLGRALLGGGALGGRLADFAGERRVRQAQGAGRGLDAVGCEYRVEHRRIQRRAEHLRRQLRLLDRGRALLVGRPGILVEVELLTAGPFARLRLRAGHGQIRADAVDRLERLSLGVAYSSRQRVHDHHEGDRDRKARGHDHRLLLAAGQLPPQVPCVHGSPLGGPSAVARL